MNDDKALKKRLKQLKKEAKKQPLHSATTDVLFWFDEPDGVEHISSKAITSPLTSSQRSPSSAKHGTYSEPRFDVSDLSTFYQPYKSKACKKCPALANGLCKCALKKMKKVA